MSHQAAISMKNRLRLSAMFTAIGLLSAAPLTRGQQDTASTIADYVVGPQDVLTITSYDQADLSGKFTVDADGTFTYPLIGRFKAGTLTLRQVEDGLRTQLKDRGYFKNPQITVSVEQFRSHRVLVVGEVRAPGMYAVSGEMNLVEAIARAGYTLPTASGEAVIVHGGDPRSGPTVPTGQSESNVVRVSLHDLENGLFSQNMALRDGDTVFVPRAESIYVFGQVRNPGAYALQQKRTTVLQALSLAGGVGDRGSTNRMHIIRLVKGDKKEVSAKLLDLVQPGDTIVVGERFF
jgi:polysaccharide export outer membrane protein